MLYCRPYLPTLHTFYRSENNTVDKHILYVLQTLVLQFLKFLGSPYILVKL